MTNWVKWSNDMGGKSRKSGGVSRALINKLLKGRKSGDEASSKKRLQRNLGLLPDPTNEGKTTS